MFISRVVSLIPSATETVVDFGLGNCIVGISHECDCVSLDGQGVCTTAKYSMEEGLSSLDVHNAASTGGAIAWEAAFCSMGESRAASIIEWGLSPYRTDPFKLRDLNPDVILTQVQPCGGAVSLEEVNSALNHWLGRPVRIVHLDPQNLEEAWEDMLKIGSALNAQKIAESKVQTYKYEISNLNSLIGKSTVFIQWIDPLFLGGAWVPELIRLAGGLDLGSCGRISQLGSNLVSWNQIAELEPQLILFSICGQKMRDSANQVRDLMRSGALAGFGKLKEKVEILVADGEKLFSSPGPSLVKSVKVLREIFASQEENNGTLWESLGHI